MNWTLADVRGLRPHEYAVVIEYLNEQLPPTETDTPQA